MNATVPRDVVNVASFLQQEDTRKGGKGEEQLMERCFVSSKAAAVPLN